MSNDVEGASSREPAPQGYQRVLLKLSGEAFAKDNKKTVGKVLDEAGVTVTGFARFKVGQA